MDNLQAIMPMLIVTIAAGVTIVTEAFQRPGERMPLGGLGLIGLVGAAVASLLLWDRNASAFGVIAGDNFALFINFVICIVGILTILFSGQAISNERLPDGEYYTLTLFATVGMMMMASATDLLVIFLALETMSLAVYVLTDLRRNDLASTEAGFKYFVLGAFSSAFFLYGVAWAFAITGSTRLDEVARVLGEQATEYRTAALLASGLLLVGFAFKVSAVPFHMWTPDAYQGAPTVVTGFMSTGVKAAAFAAFVRVFLNALEPLRPDWAPVVWVLAAVTMIAGTVLGIVQSNVKRMLAYSSIAHAGYLLVGLLAASSVGKSAILFYLLAYAVTNVGAFGVVALLASPDRPHDELKDFSGLWNRRPGLATMLAIFLLSLGGFPPLAGFVAKWYIFSAAIQEGYYGLAIIGVLTSVVSVFFYLRIVVAMYMTEGAPAVEGVASPRLPIAGAAALAIAVVATFYLGMLPTSVIDLAARSIESIAF